MRLYNQSLGGLILDRIFIVGLYLAWLALCASPVIALVGLVWWAVS